MKDKKKIVIGTLCALIMIMAVGYALLSKQLNINGTANITSTWKIEITNITEKEKHGGVTEKSKSYDAMTANFNVGFTSPGDYIIYEVEVTNSGTLDAVIERVNVVTNDNPAIKYTTSGIERGDIIEHNSKKYLTVKIEYDSSVTSQPQTNNNGLTLQLFTEQNLGQVQPEYQTYSIGDKVTFAGAGWYVIKDSTSAEEYVTLLKETVLTNAELWPYVSDSNDATTFGGNTFETSSIKRAVDYYMRNKKNELKEVDGYKIRLITKDELINCLGYKEETYISAGDVNITYNKENVPTWVYQNFGENQNGVFGYWTMTPHPGYSYPSHMWIVEGGSGDFTHNYSELYTYISGVRPVINLLKSSIE